MQCPMGGGWVYYLRILILFKLGIYIRFALLKEARYGTPFGRSLGISAAALAWIEGIPHQERLRFNNKMFILQVYIINMILHSCLFEIITPTLYQFLLYKRGRGNETVWGILAVIILFIWPDIYHFVVTLIFKGYFYSENLYSLQNVQFYKWFLPGWKTLFLFFYIKLSQFFKIYQPKLSTGSKSVEKKMDFRFCWRFCSGIFKTSPTQTFLIIYAVPCVRNRQ